MFNNILVPLDGSAYSERVLAHLTAFLEPRSTRLILLNATGQARPVALGGVVEPFVTPAGNVQEMQTYLKGWQGELQSLGFDVHVQVVEGDVASMICQTANEHAVDMIAMTTHGRSGLSRWALGSVADHVVRIAEQPVFLVRGASEIPDTPARRRILVPLDGSPLAEQALLPAVRIAKELDAVIVLVRAIHLRTERELDGIYREVEGVQGIKELRMRAAKRYLRSIQEKLEAMGCASETVVEQQLPACAIIEVAERDVVSLIVMSTHARSGLRRLVYGSVADSVLRGAGCPVVLTHPMEAAVRPVVAAV